MLVPGYITNITNDACYVRFLGQLTGRAGLAQLADLFVSDPSRHFHVGQSVRAQVVQVRPCMSAKQSLSQAIREGWGNRLDQQIGVCESIA